MQSARLEAMRRPCSNHIDYRLSTTEVNHARETKVQDADTKCELEDKLQMPATNHL